MMRSLVSIILCVAVAVLGGACATKEYVLEQVGALENKLGDRIGTTQAQLSERAELQETKLRETTERTGENRRAVDVADQRLKGLDSRVGEVGAVAESARTGADRATAVAQGAEDRLAQRFAGRNNYRLLDTQSVYFGSGQVELRGRDVRELDEVARVLASDPNAIVELRGFADSQGSDRYNRELARERVEAVVNYLVEKHGTELRQLRGAAMGKVALAAGEKPTSEALARSRRVEVRLFTPWSSWEDSQALGGPTTPEQAASTPPTSSPVPAAAAPATVKVPTPTTTTPPASTTSPASSDPPATTKVAAGPDRIEPALLPKAVLDEPHPRRVLPGLLRTITPRDLGAQ